MDANMVRGGGHTEPVVLGVVWPPGLCGRTGDSKARLLFGHGPSDHEWLFVIMSCIYQIGTMCQQECFTK
jgi:hypothetical protein